MSTLLVASTGGHLSELHKLGPRLTPVDPPFRWVTFDTPQSQALLADEDVSWAAYTGQRDYKNIVANMPLAARMLRSREVRAVITTGAAVALSFLPLARALGKEVHYIEGIARTEGPSATMKALQAIPGVHFYTQWEKWATPKWPFRGSVFDAFEPAPTDGSAVEIRRVVVMVGTMPYSFRRLIERLVEILPPQVEVLWQTGKTPVDGLPIAGVQAVPPKDLDAAIAAADVVVQHAGGGSALQVMEAGKCPVIVPREAAHHEHVDDHQLELAELLPQMGLAVAARAQELTLEHLRTAAARRIIRLVHPPAFHLG